MNCPCFSQSHFLLILIFLIHSTGFFFPSDIWWFLLVHLQQLSEFLSKAVTALTSFVFRCVGGELQVIIWDSNVRVATPTQAALLLLKHCILFVWRGVVTLLLLFLPAHPPSPSTSLLPVHCFSFPPFLPPSPFLSSLLLSFSSSFLSLFFYPPLG